MPDAAFTLFAAVILFFIRHYYAELPRAAELMMIRYRYLSFVSPLFASR